MSGDPRGQYCKDCLDAGHFCDAVLFVGGEPLCLDCADDQPCAYVRHKKGASMPDVKRSQVPPPPPPSRPVPASTSTADLVKSVKRVITGKVKIVVEVDPDRLDSIWGDLKPELKAKAISAVLAETL